jgi:amino acid transporter
MSSAPQKPASSGGAIPPNLTRPIQVIVVSSVMFTFISYWRTAAVVLCDLASTAYYIGGIVEGQIGACAPWFILAVMMFSYAVRSIYIESCSLFVRGGVYRVVKEAMGGFLAKLSVSALMFDYVLTGPISGVSAGQYIMGLVRDTVRYWDEKFLTAPGASESFINFGSVIIAVLITLYFFRQNILGIHESSGKALKIMYATTVMAAVIFVWCGVTLVYRGGPVNPIPVTPDLSPKISYREVTGDVIRKGRVIGEKGVAMWERNSQTRELVPQYEEKRDEKGDPVKDAAGNPVMVPKPALNTITNKQQDPLGAISRWFPSFANKLRKPFSWFSLIGVIGLLIAFGHSILAMSGEETLAQVYREVESPKMLNFKKAAFVVFVYSVVLTGGISFLAVMLIPDEVRMKTYNANLIGGLSMYMVGPYVVRLLLNAFVVVVGFLILAGAVNTAIIGSNGVLNRVAEDGVMPDWFLKPHARYGTTHRILWLIIILQLATILLSGGNMDMLGEAYAFGVVWSFVFKALAMVVLRFKDKTPREYKVPLNFHVGGIEIPMGLILVFLILLFTALLNLLTKEVATISGSIFTGLFLIIFMVSERIHEKRAGGLHHKHVEQFNQQTASAVNPVTLSLEKPFRKLVAIRSTSNLFMLEKTLAETDPDTTDVAVMTAQVAKRGDASSDGPQLDDYARNLMSAVVERAEKAGKHVQPIIVKTNNPLYAVIQAAKDLGAQELIMGGSNVYSADEQIEQIAFYWINLNGGVPTPLTIRILSPTRDLSFDLAGGNRIPKLGERRARSIAELRSAGVGVSHVLLVHEDTSSSSDLFSATLTMIDPAVKLTIVNIAGCKNDDCEIDFLQQDINRAKQLRRGIELRELAAAEPSLGLAKMAMELKVNLILLGKHDDAEGERPSAIDPEIVAREATCAVAVVTQPRIPDEVDANQV